jgi:hypothetical protein
MGPDRRPIGRAHELIPREGSPRDLLDYIDGVLLVDIWKELELPDSIRRDRLPVIRQTLPPRRRLRATGSRSDGSPGVLLRLRPSQRARTYGQGRNSRTSTPAVGSGWLSCVRRPRRWRGPTPRRSLQ